MGEMLMQTWEGYATQLVNAEQGDLLTALKDVIEKEAINMSQEVNVFIGKDTRYDLQPCLSSHPGDLAGVHTQLITPLDLYRSSSARLSLAVVDGVHALGGHVKGRLMKLLNPNFKMSLLSNIHFHFFSSLSSYFAV